MVWKATKCGVFTRMAKRSTHSCLLPYGERLETPAPSRGRSRD